MSAGDRSRRRDAGFTLIECLVALVVFALATVALHRGLAGGIAGLARSDAQVRAVEFARALLASAGVETPLAPGRRTETSDDGMIGTMDVSLRDDGRSAAPRAVIAYDVTVSVRLSRAPDGPPAVTLTTIRLASSGPPS
jgi:prepilin-type N-terminal cleavage/methylation domain-containing protein